MGSVKKSMYFLLPVFFLLLVPLVFAPEEHLLPLQGTAKLNDAKMSGGDLIIEIYDAPSSGNLVYNSTNDFLNIISSGAYDILLGNGTQPLSLNYSTKYYMDMYINNVDVDFNGSERQVFMSTIGNLSVTTPIKTTSNDTDDALNVSGGAVIGSAGGTGPVLRINSTGPAAFNVNNLFNISGLTGATRISGITTVLSTDKDDALNVSGGAIIGSASGGLSILRIASRNDSALTVNNFFNISGGNGDTRISGTVTMLASSADVLNVSGGASIGLLTYADRFSIDTNGAVVIRIPDSDDALNITRGGGVSISALQYADRFDINGSDGTVTIRSPNADDALNITRGGMVVGLTTYASRFSVADTGLVTIRSSDPDDALNITQGGFIAGNATDFVRLDYTQNANRSLFTVKNLFNISAEGNVRIGMINNSQGNGTVTILSADTDDALNVTSGGLFIGSNAVFNNFFNITTTASQITTNGTVRLLSGDLDDALNLTSGGLAVFGGDIRVRNDDATVGARLAMFDGGANNCAVIELFDETGENWFLFVNTTGGLRIAATLPTTCDTEGTPS